MCRGPQGFSLKAPSPEHSTNLLQPHGNDRKLRSAHRGDLVYDAEPDWPQYVYQVVELLAFEVFGSIGRVRVEDTVNGL